MFLRLHREPERNTVFANVRFIVIFALLLCAGCGSDYPNVRVFVGDQFDVSQERARFARDVVASDPNARQRIVVVVFGAESEIEDLYTAETQRVLNQLYTLKTIRVALPYDEAADFKSYNRSMNSGEFPADLTFDFYLLNKNRPYSRQEIETMRRFGITKTPAVFVLDRRGNTTKAFRNGEFPNASELMLYSQP
jgi:hypothetical protein